MINMFGAVLGIAQLLPMPVPRHGRALYHNSTARINHASQQHEMMRLAEHLHNLGLPERSPWLWDKHTDFCLA